MRKNFKESWSEFDIIKEPGLRPRLSDECRGNVYKAMISDGDFVILRVYRPTEKNVEKIKKAFRRFMKENNIDLQVILAGVDFDLELMPKEKAIEILNKC